MANIISYINKIKTALYGKDVRSSLADGLHAVNKETELATMISQETQDRQVDLESRWDNVLAETTDGAEVIDARIDVGGNKHVTVKRRLDNDFNQTEDKIEKLKTSLIEREINIKDLGIKGDGTNETELLLSIINYVADNHVTLVIPKNLTINIDVMTIMNKNNFGIRCEGTIKRMNNSPTVGPLLKFDGCSNVTIPEIHFNGNGLNNGCIENVAYTPNQEHKHDLSILNCNDVTIDKVTSLNPCGDCVYISNGSKNVKVKTINGKADVQIGRNVVSLINCEDIHIDDIYSDNIGHFDMPGGFDIEPNSDKETVKNVFIKSINITGGGTNPCSILGMKGSTVENVFIDSVNLIRTNSIQSSTEIHSVYITASNVHIGKLSIINKTPLIINGITLNQHGKIPKGIYINDAYLYGCYRGIQVGVGLKRADDVYIKAVMRNTVLDGVNFGTCKNVVLDLDIDSVGADRFMINKPSDSGRSENVTIRGDISKRGTGLKAIISNEFPTNVVNWTFENLDFTGWEDNCRIYGSGMLGTVRKSNCRNLTGLPAKPSWEVWKTGDVVKNTTPVELGNIGSKYIIEKWIAVADGTGSSIWRDGRVLTGN